LSPPSHLEIIPLGGLGEFGMNMTVVRWGEDCVLVDAGMMFPSAGQYGVEAVIPDMSFLDDCGKLHGVVLTHGHEDHIGALPHLLARRDLPVYAAPYTEGLVRRRLEEHGLLDGRTLKPLPATGERLELGPFSVETVSAAHSIPQARMIVLRTPIGIVVHTADFKLDHSPVEGRGTDLSRLSALGDEGVLALLADSTNADVPGFTPGERSVSAGIGRVIAGCRGRVVVTTFASQVHRLQELGRLSRIHGRRLALVGASLQSHAEIAERLGLLQLQGVRRVSADAVADLEPRQVLVAISGSQGEPLSAMTRVATGRHRQIEVTDGDIVIHSAREIPGNEKSIGRMINELLRRGAEVVTARDAPVHASGHGAQEELRIVLSLIRPRYLVPIHGEYRQLRAHARLAVDGGLDAGRVQLANTGDVIAVDRHEISVRDRVRAGPLLIDSGLNELDPSVLRDRRQLAGDGIIVPVVAVGKNHGRAATLPEIHARGFAPLGETPDDGLILEARQAVADAVRDASPEERTDAALLRARVQADLKRFFRKRTQRQPLVLPVIVEL